MISIFVNLIAKKVSLLTARNSGFVFAIGFIGSAFRIEICP